LEKASISKFVVNSEGQQTEDVMKSVFEMVKFCVKDVKGVTYSDGTKMVLQFEENGHMTEESIDELLTLSISADLTTSLFAFLAGIPDKIVNAATGEELRHVKIVVPKAQPTKKK